MGQFQNCTPHKSTSHGITRTSPYDSARIFPNGSGRDFSFERHRVARSILVPALHTVSHLSRAAHGGGLAQSAIPRRSARLPRLAPCGPAMAARQIRLRPGPASGISLRHAAPARYQLEDMGRPNAGKKLAVYADPTGCLGRPNDEFSSRRFPGQAERPFHTRMERQKRRWKPQGSAPSGADREEPWLMVLVVGNIRAGSGVRWEAISSSAIILNLAEACRAMRFRLDSGSTSRDDSSLCSPPPISFQFAAARCRPPAPRLPRAGVLAHGASDAERSRLPVRALRPRNVGEALAPRRLLHKLRQHSRWSARLPGLRSPARAQ